MNTVIESKLKLSARDIQIVRYAYEQKFLTLEHAETFFPTACAKSAACKRLRVLIRAGFLQRRPSICLKRSLIFLATKKGVELVSPYLTYEQDPVLKATNSQLNHDSIVTSVRLEIEKALPEIAWMSERAIKARELSVIPDGFIVFPGQRFWAIEVENSSKWRQVYLTLFNRWADLPSVECVLYLATNAGVYNALNRAAKAVPNSKIRILMKEDLGGFLKTLNTEVAA